MRLVRKTRLAAALVTLALALLVLSPTPASAGTATAADVSGGKIGREVQRALFGVHLTGSGETWTSTSMTFTDVNTANFDMSELQGNGPTDGVAIFRDDGEVADVFDAGDTQVSDDFVAVGLEVTVNLEEAVPETATGTYNYFITIATSPDIDNGDDFTVTLPSGCDAFDTGGIACPVLGGTNFDGLTSGTITADAVAPIAFVTDFPEAATDNVVWTFSENVVGVDEPNVVLREDGSSTDLGATVTYNATAKTATINPTLPLTPGDAYDTLVNPSSAEVFVTDTAGNPVAENTSAAFEVDDIGFTPGLVRGNAWFINEGYDPFAEEAFTYGSSGDKIVVGDWDGDGTFTPGIVRGNRWFLNENTDANADHVFFYGSSTDKPVVGDWNGDGTWTPGVVRGNLWLLNNTFDGTADDSLRFGVATDRPVVGDWDGDDDYTPGVVRGNVWHLNNDTFDPFAHESFAFGRSTDKPVVGDWDGDGFSTPGVVRGNRWFLANDLEPHVTFDFLFGSASDQFIAGDWDGSIDP